MDEPIVLQAAPPPDVVDADSTRKLVVKLVFFQFMVSVVGISAAMIFKGWTISNTGLTILTMVMQAEIAAMLTAVGFYLGSSQKQG